MLTATAQTVTQAIQKLYINALNVQDLKHGEYNMGSGSKFKFSKMEGVGLGVYISRFPHQLSININFIMWNLYIGFGKGYDE